MGDLPMPVLATLVAAVLGAACGGAAGGDPTPSDAPASATVQAKRPDRAAYLLPDLHSLPAEDIQITLTDAGTRDLRFSATIANTGVGPLIVAPDDHAVCPAGQRHAAQRVVADVDGDGRFDPAVDRSVKPAPGGCMVDHPTHLHWHFDASASYVLTRPGDDVPIVTSDKVSFCLRDSHPLEGPARDGAFGDCDRESIQGISVGFGDLYRFDLDGQALPLPRDLADGVYCLTLSADPDRLLRELDDGDNASTVGVQVIGSTAAPAAAPACEGAAPPP
ncbi:lysyl oxidase family protein [Jiangella asiatica]|uniref:Lysyl oxidase n=1 Tax=Jiangella asiatica TaxID=2530372 RepID=A0A4R5CN75_9ACTN|nr:lysyl oxidase family protein [Jiangella asiatica]TDD99002.1 hypothetical protein E1269_28000 [Jiangella asiatica]